MVHAGDFDQSGLIAPPFPDALDGVVRAAVALEHLARFRARGEAEELVAKANAENRQSAVHHRLDHRDRVSACCRRITWSIRQKYAIWLMA